MKELKSIILPPDFPVGEIIKEPTSCANCKHLVNKNECDDEEFINWLQSNKIPGGDPKFYCCIYWHKKPSPLNKIKLNEKK